MRRSLIVAIAALAVAVGPMAGAGVKQSTDVHVFPDGPAIEGASASLNRTPGGVSLRIQTSELDGGSAYTIWVVAWNDPSVCSEPEDEDPGCGMEDLLDPGNSVMYGAGHVVGGNGRATFSGHRSTDDDSGALFGDGVTNPLGAEIHLVVRTHGPAQPGYVDAQISTFNGGCNPGEPNEGLCDDQQAAVFLPPA